MDDLMLPPCFGIYIYFSKSRFAFLFCHNKRNNISLSHNLWCFLSPNFEIKQNSYGNPYLIKKNPCDWKYCGQHLIYTLFVKINISKLDDSIKASSTAAWYWNCLFVVKLSRYLKKWKSIGERSGEYGGWGKIAILKLFNYVCVILAKFGRALSWRWIGPFLLTKAGCFSYNFLYISCNCWRYFKAVIVSLGFKKL